MLCKRNLLITFHYCYWSKRCVLSPCSWFSARSAVLGCYLTEQLFLENDGVFHLMDLLQVTQTNCHQMHQSTSCHATLCHLSAGFRNASANQRASKSHTCELFNERVVSLTSSQAVAQPLPLPSFYWLSNCLGQSKSIKEPHVQIALWFLWRLRLPDSLGLVKGAKSRFAGLEKCGLNLSSLSFVIRVNLLHS